MGYQCLIYFIHLVYNPKSILSKKNICLMDYIHQMRGHDELRRDYLQF